LREILVTEEEEEEEEQIFVGESVPPPWNILRSGRCG
jgi:hypothetical protein